MDRLRRWHLPWLTLAELCAQLTEIVIQRIDLLLQRSNVSRHLLVFLRVFEAVAAIWRVHALEVEVAASLTWCLPVALDL